MNHQIIKVIMFLFGKIIFHYTALRSISSKKFSNCVKRLVVCCTYNSIKSINWSHLWIFGRLIPFRKEWGFMIWCLICSWLAIPKLSNFFVQSISSTHYFCILNLFEVSGISLKVIIIVFISWALGGKIISCKIFIAYLSLFLKWLIRKVYIIDNLWKLLLFNYWYILIWAW